MAIELMAKIKPKGGGTFAMVDAADVEMPDGTRLDKVVENIKEEITGAGVVVSDEPPKDTRVLWIDPDDTGSDSGVSVAQALGEIDALLGGDG